eukprot:925858-Prorocentrum_minimum.AAC.1
MRDFSIGQSVRARGRSGGGSVSRPLFSPLESWRSGGPFAEPFGGSGGCGAQIRKGHLLARKTTSTPNMRLPYALKFLVRGAENAQCYCALETINYRNNTRYSAVTVQSQYSTVTAQSQHCHNTVAAQSHSQHSHSTVAAL